MSNDKTKWIFDDSPDGGGGEKTFPPNEMTETLDDKTQAGFGRGSNTISEEPTIHLSGSDAPTSEETVIYTRNNAEAMTDTAGQEANVDPVTGWLVVVKGPGMGYSATLGVGMNIVGRGGNSVRCALPFGDRMISSEDHVRIIYDEDERKFFIAHGAGKNVSRVNGQLLMNTMELEDGASIALSKLTTVVFRSFCGSGFDWSDVDSDAETKGDAET